MMGMVRPAGYAASVAPFDPQPVSGDRRVAHTPISFILGVAT
jgi:hypothetical protein